MAEPLQAFDAALDVQLAATLAGLSLVSFAFLVGRMRQIEAEAGQVNPKRAGGSLYAESLAREVRRFRRVARSLVAATLAFLASAAMMFAFFDTWLLGRGETWIQWLDVLLTGVPFAFGIAALIVGTWTLGREWLVG